MLFCLSSYSLFTYCLCSGDRSPRSSLFYSLFLYCSSSRVITCVLHNHRLCPFSLQVFSSYFLYSVTVPAHIQLLLILLISYLFLLIVILLVLLIDFLAFLKILIFVQFLSMYYVLFIFLPS